MTKTSDELSRHQIELELLKEDLLKKQNEIEAVKNNFEDLFDSAPNGYLEINHEMAILKCNLTFASMVGLSRQNVINTRLSDYLLSDFQDTVYLKCKEVFKNKSLANCEVGIKTAFGRDLQVRLDGKHIFQNGFDFVRVSIIDITGQKEAEKELLEKSKEVTAQNEELQAQNEQLAAQNLEIAENNNKLIELNLLLKLEKEKAQSYLDLAGVMFIAIGPDEKVFLANKKASEIMGLPQEEIIGKNWFDNFLPAGVRDHVKIVFRKILSGEIQSLDEYENGIINSRGEERIIIWRNTILIDIDGKPYGTLSSGADITERRRAVEYLRLSEERFNLAMNAANDGLYDWNLVTNEIYYSPRWKSMLGYADNELKNEFSIWETLTEVEDVKKSWAMLNELVERKRDRYEMEFKMLHKDGHWVDIFSRANAIFDHTGKAVRVVGTHVDVTQRKLSENALKMSEDKLKTIFRVAPTGIGLIINREIIEINPKVCEMIGYEKSELVGKSSRIFYASDEDFDFVGREKYRQIAESGVGKVETRWMKKDGTIIDILLSSSPIVVDDLSKGVIFTALDITDRKADERKIRESVIKWQTTFDGISDGVMLLDSEGRIKQLNKGACTILGKSENELLECHCFEMVHCTKSHIEDCPFVRMKTSLKRESMLMPVESKWFIIIVDPLFDEKGQIAGAVHIVSDITKRKLAEEVLIKSEIKFRTYIENSPTSIFIANGMGEIIFTNQASARLLGYTKDELVNMTIPQFMPESEIEKGLEDFSTVKTQGYSASNELIFKKKDGTLIDILIASVKLNDNEFMAYCRDITDLKNTQRELQLKNEEYQTLNEELQQNFDKIRQINEQLKIARAQAEESDRLKSAFLANMSHEIRTPMNGILGFAELLKEPDLTGDEQQKYVSIIEKSGQRMLNIINDLIDISKIEAGQMEVSTTQTSVNQHLNNLFVFFRPEAERNGLSLSFQNSLPDSEAIINTDSEKLYAILTNLIKNAIKYTHRGSIEFGYKIVETLHARSLQFFVKDTGIGIKKEKQKAIFERFVQADTMITKPYEGAGLGLSISKAYVEMLGGKIWVESEFGVGSTFWFTIPTHAKEKENNGKKDVQIAVPCEEKPLNLKILIAEDTEASDIYLSQLVRKISTQVTHVTTGTEAVRHCRTHPDTDLVLMDIKMPQMDGYEATRRIREFNKNVLIIAQTAYALTGDREKALAAGCNDYLAKPIKKAVLVETIRKYF